MSKHLVWIAMEDDETARRLLEVARRHVGLALEHGRANTLPERRKAIRNEIRQLRIERDKLLCEVSESNI